MEIGSKLKNARNEKGITQEQAAELLGVSRQTISNWENNKSYPDIVSVIKMSDSYSVSLDHLLKEEKSMKQTYQEFLEESTNTVRAKNNLSKSIILATYFAVWIIAMVVFWTMKGNVADYIFSSVDIILRWIMLPLLLLVLTVMIAKNNYFGSAKWIFIVGAAITFLTVPYTQYIVIPEEELSYYMFKFPNIPYMLVGIVVAIGGLCVGSLWRNSLLKTKKDN